MTPEEFKSLNSKNTDNFKVAIDMTIHVVPLSPTARFLATQLSSESFRPNILLPKHLLKPFLTSESTITYINEISPLNSFQRKHTYPTSSTRYLETISRISAAATSQISIALPSSQIRPIFNSESIKFIPPPNSDIIILDPHFGQAEKYVSSVMSNFQISASSPYDLRSLPRFWSIVSTHLLADAPSWGIKHQSVGEFIVSPILPFANDSRTEIELINSSDVMKQILNTPTLSPQYEPYLKTKLLLLEQLIIETALCSIIYTDYSSKYEVLRSYSKSRSFASNNDIYSDVEDSVSAKSLVLNIIDECIAVLRKHEPVLELEKTTPMLTAVLSRERLFNLTLNILQNDTSLPNLKHYKQLMNESFSNYTNDDQQKTESPHFRNPARANRFIFKLGLQVGVKTPSNNFVCDNLSAQYPEIHIHDDDP